MSLHELRKNNYEKVAKENPDSVDGQDTERTSFFGFYMGDLYASAKGKKKTQSHVYDSAFFHYSPKDESIIIFQKYSKKKPDSSAFYVLG